MLRVRELRNEILEIFGDRRRFAGSVFDLELYKFELTENRYFARSRFYQLATLSNEKHKKIFFRINELFFIQRLVNSVS